MTVPAVDVAVGILLRRDGRFLLTQRPPGKAMPGFWEFPGGKLEPGETVHAALVREFQEELGVLITGADPWVERTHVYAHATVRLHFWRAREWSGEPQSLEGQRLRWESVGDLCVEPWLPGALVLKRWLDLPDWYAISGATELGLVRFLERVDALLARGALKLLQLREPRMDTASFGSLFREVRARCVAHGVRLLINSSHDERYWHAADGVHCTARTLGALVSRPGVAWCAASCHDAAELARAGDLGIDFAVLGPVELTPSHPDVPGLGWERFSVLRSQAALPVYALGGLSDAHRALARRAGAQGIAALRASWSAGPAARLSTG